LPRCAACDLAGGDSAANLAALEAVFEGRDVGAHRAALALQAGLALCIGGRTESIGAGVALARAAIESGRAQQWLQRLRRVAAGGRR
jgi:anthranilate phosphoribosyltransferase